MSKDKKLKSLKEFGKLIGQNNTKSRYHQGIIKKYNSAKGFGFIKQDRGKDLFFYIRDVQKGIPTEGASVKYIIGKGREGKESAKKVIVQKALYLPDDTQTIIEPTECENILLSLNKVVEWEPSKKNAGKIEIPNDFLNKMETKPFSEITAKYSAKRHQNLIERLKYTHYVSEPSFKVDWRMVVGLGAENVHETSMTLHHIYGIPYIPGSALKGIARDAAVADLCSEVEYEKPDVMDALISMPASDEKDEDKRRKEIKKNGKLKRQNKDSVEPENTTIDKIIKGWPDFETARKVFGGQKQAGKVIFFDAFPEKDVSIKPDIMNPHYPKYYSKGEDPTDWQNPNPIKFLTVENTSFNFALALNKKETDKNRNKIDSNPALLDIAEKWLRKALEDHGVGAKTSVGYGYFKTH